MSHSPVSTQTSTRPPSRVSCEFDSWYQELGIHSIEDIPARCSSLIEWTKTKPLFILQLDPVDRAILRIADGITIAYPFNTKHDKPATII
uniref:Uncharacterized protein n=1 Tax=Tetranychus urticae TaxID=32264 RepID=T1KNN6_TETUR